jgi:hypothetical protein
MAILMIPHAFHRPKVSIALQRMQVVSILRCVIIAYESSLRFIAFLCFPSSPFFYTLLGLVLVVEHNLLMEVGLRAQNAI